MKTSFFRKKEAKIGLILKRSIRDDEEEERKYCQICLHKGRDRTKSERLSEDPLIQNRLNAILSSLFSLAVPPPLTPLRPLLLPSFSWFHTLPANIAADRSTNHRAGIVSPQPIAPTAPICAWPPPSRAGPHRAGPHRAGLTRSVRTRPQTPR